MMASLQHIKVKNMKCVFITFFTPRGPLRADASPCMVLMDDDIADTLRDIKLLARSKWDFSSSGMLRNVYLETDCPETSVSDHQSTLCNKPGQRRSHLTLHFANYLPCYTISASRHL